MERYRIVVRPGALHRPLVRAKDLNPIEWRRDKEEAEHRSSEGGVVASIHTSRGASSPPSVSLALLSLTHCSQGQSFAPPSRSATAGVAIHGRTQCRMLRGRARKQDWIGGGGYGGGRGGESNGRVGDGLRVRCRIHAID